MGIYGNNTLVYQKGIIEENRSTIYSTLKPPHNVLLLTKIRDSQNLKRNK